MSAVIVATILVAGFVTARVRRRGEEGASYVLAVLLIAAVTISMAWLAKDTLFDTQNKANDQIKTEVGEFGK
jgi:hypothetical protein